MTGSGSAMVAYFKSKKDVNLRKKCLIKIIKLLVYSIKNYINLFFLCYMNQLLGRSQAVRHGFLVPAS